MRPKSDYYILLSTFPCLWILPYSKSNSSFEFSPISLMTFFSKERFRSLHVSSQLQCQKILGLGGELKSKINNRTRNLQTSWEPLTEMFVMLGGFCLPHLDWSPHHAPNTRRNFSVNLLKKMLNDMKNTTKKLWKMISDACTLNVNVKQQQYDLKNWWFYRSQLRYLAGQK